MNEIVGQGLSHPKFFLFIHYLDVSYFFPVHSLTPDILCTASSGYSLSSHLRS